jgi:hypothetical protein
MLWELYQLGRIQQVQQEASHALGSANRAKSDLGAMQREVTMLEQQVERLTLATVAMIEILRDRHGVSEAEFEARVREIDLRDGRLDGKLQQSRPPQNCPSCRRPNGSTRAACLYCGAALPPSGVVG